MAAQQKYRNPAPTVDAIIELKSGGIVLVERKNPPYGWALPGGFIDYGESAESAVVREAKEEVCLDIELKELLGVYSDPSRDPRKHTLSIVFIATAEGEPVAADDAKTVAVVTEETVPQQLAFDHALIISDYFAFKKTGKRSLGVPK